VLIRHAKAADGAVDLERPLTDRGRRQAAGIGSTLRGADLVPDAVVVSPARRAQQTWEGAAAALVPPPTSTVDERIYDNTAEALLEVVREASEEVRTLAVVGHAPSVRELADVLDDGGGDPEVRSAFDAGFPTGTVAVLELAAPFAELAEGGATLRDVIVPGD
jgi:phosphohistidine phosphatase